MPDERTTTSATPEGVRSGQIDIQLVTKAARGDWAKLLGGIGVADALPFLPETIAPLNVVATIVALPDNLGPGCRYLFGNVTLTPLEAEEAHWFLRLTTLGDLSPPASVVESSRSVGGYPGVLAQLQARWPTSRVQDISFQAAFLVEEASWTSLLAPQKRMGPGTRRRGRKRDMATLEGASYTWKMATPGPVTDIIDTGLSGPGSVGITCHGRLEAVLGPLVFDRIEAESWNVLRNFLRPARRRRRAGRGHDQG